MKLSMKTEKLKEMIARAVKGVGNNKLIPLTSLMAIELKDNTLTLITTDATNYLYITDEHVVGDDFYAVVDANVFSKLISKLTCENVVMEIKSELKYLEVKGNGTYKIELPLDENGDYIKYPDPCVSVNLSNAVTTTLNKTTVAVILETVKSALATTLENPCYTGYYMADKVVATDTYKIACMDVNMFTEPKLISAELLDLIAVMQAEKIEVNIQDNDIVFSTPDCTICGKLMEGIEDFAIDPIMNLVDADFGSSCSVPKNALLQLLDRLSLFVGPYDKNAVYLTFTKDGLQISSKVASGVEIIPYISSDNFNDFTCAIDIQMFLNEVKAISNDVIEIYYDSDTAIKLVDGNITIIIALLDDSE